MSSAALELLLENKKEYVAHLNQLLTEPLYMELQSLYQVAQKTASADKVLELFQEQLTKIPLWNADQVSALKDRVYIRMNCDYFAELVKATFMVYLKLHLATLPSAGSIPSLKIKVPSMETYLHRVLVATARMLWKKPYLMFHKVRTLEKQKNLLQCENYIHKAISQTIQGSLPLNEIFRYISKETHIHPPSKREDPEAEPEPDSATDPLESEGEADADTEDEAEDEADSEEEEAEEDEADAEDEIEADAEIEASAEEESEAEPESEESEEDEADAEAEAETEPGPEEPKEPSIIDSGYESSKESLGEEKDFNLVSAAPAPGIKQIEITGKSQRKLHRPAARPMVLKRVEQAFF
jgi:Family of unknown function (DUF5764)